MYYHGSDTKVERINTGTEMGLYITPDHFVAAAYGSVVLALTLAESANLADVHDLRDAVEAVRWIDEEAGEALFDSDDYEDWALIEMTEVRDHLAAAGYDGIEFLDVTPSGDDHTAVLIWNTSLLTLVA